MGAAPAGRCKPRPVNAGAKGLQQNQHRALPYSVFGQGAAGVKPRRAGDIPECYADCTKAYEELGWKAQKTLDDMCADSWRWQTQNPNGYNG